MMRASWNYRAANWWMGIWGKGHMSQSKRQLLGVSLSKFPEWMRCHTLAPSWKVRQNLYINLEVNDFMTPTKSLLENLVYLNITLVHFPNPPFLNSKRGRPLLFMMISCYITKDPFIEDILSLLKEAQRFPIVSTRSFDQKWHAFQRLFFGVFFIFPQFS